MKPLPTVCILAGGRGTRLGAATTRLPKPLAEVAGEPFLVHQLRLLAQEGARDVVLCVGHLGTLIEKRIGPDCSGVRVSYSYDGPALKGTLGAIRQALPQLPTRFLVLYGDAYLRLNYRDAVRSWSESGLAGFMSVFRNDGRWDRSNVVFQNGRVTHYDKATPVPGMRWIDYGLGGLHKRALHLVDETVSDLSVLQSVMAARGQLHGYEVTDRFYEIGTPEALAETDRFLRSQAPASG